MSDFRELCAELADALDSWLMAHHYGGVPPQDGVDAKLVLRARAALAQPELQGVSDEAIMRLACSLLGYEFTPSLISNPENGIGALEAFPSELLAFARAVLARWGRPTSEEN